MHIQMDEYARRFTRRASGEFNSPLQGQAMFLMFGAYNNDGTQIAGIWGIWNINADTYNGNNGQAIFGMMDDELWMTVADTYSGDA